MHISKGVTELSLRGPYFERDIFAGKKVVHCLRVYHEEYRHTCIVCSVLESFIAFTYSELQSPWKWCVAAAQGENKKGKI